MGKGSGQCARPAMAFAGGSGIAGLSEADEAVIVEVLQEAVLNQTEREQLLEELSARQWREPEELDQILADMTADMVGVSRVTALRLEKEDFGGDDYEAYRRFLWPSRGDVMDADETVAGMRSGAARVIEHIDNGEKIAVFADYDVDGNTSATLARQSIESAGGEVHLEFASAANGFGLNHDVVDRAHAAGCGVLITVDCGSTQSEAVAYAQSLGMEVIVIDHHDVDMDNPADFHLNPRYDQGLHRDNGVALAERATKVKGQLTRAQTALRKAPDNEAKAEKVAELEAEQAELMQKMIDFCPPAPFEIESFVNAHDRLKRRLEVMMDDEMGTGAQLTWKFGAEVLRARGGDVPDDWYGQPMYLAGLGAMADRADMRILENRAFSRVPLDEIGIDAVPLGVQLLAEHFEEDPLRPSKMMRTKATLNLAKRTPRVSGDKVVELYTAQTPAEAASALAFLIEEHTKSADAREEMEALAHDYIDQWRAIRLKRKKASKHKYWVHTVINDEKYEEYVGQSGVIADRLAREHGLPAIVFTRQGTDANGDPVLKWSSRNGQVKTKIGGLLDEKWKAELTAVCQIPKQTDDGIVYRGSVGGHEDVVSGSCRADQVKEVMKVLNRFADTSDASSWQSKKASRIWTSARKVPGDQLDQLDQEAALIEPATNENYPTRISVVGAFSHVGPVDPDRKTAPATLQVDGVTRQCQISEEAFRAIDGDGGQPWEVIVHPGPDEYYIKHLRPLDADES